MKEKEDIRSKPIHLAYRYRLILKKDQAKSFCQYAGNCRYIYNWALSLKDKAYKERQENLREFDISRLLTLHKKEGGKEWLLNSPSQTLQQTIKDLHTAYTNFFKKRASFPQYKKKGKSTDSFRFPDPSGFKFEKLNKNKASLTLPKVGEVKLNYSREIQGEILNATVAREGKHWYISLCCKKNLNYIPLRTSEIGIDRGITHTLSTSQGEFFDLPVQKIKSLEKRKGVLQTRMTRGRKVEKREKWSESRLKKQEKIKKLDLKIKRIRYDWMHKTSTTLAKSHSLIVLEDLQIQNMTKSAKGTTENPGKQVVQKRGLNRSILRQGWGIFETQLNYKMEWIDSLCLKVDPKFTSQDCSVCSYRSKGNRESQSLFHCKSCGYSENADINASRNILNSIKSPSGGGVESVELLPIGKTVKQKPLELVRLKAL